jgi:hypothetical protein
MTWLFHGIGTLAIDGLNALIAALAYAVNAVLGLLPVMPSFPAMPAQVTQVLGWINWFFPVGTLYDILVFFVSAWAVWLVVRLALNWARFGAAT